MEQAAEEEESSSEKPSENVEVISEKPKDCEVTETAEAKKGTHSLCLKNTCFKQWDNLFKYSQNINV